MHRLLLLAILALTVCSGALVRAQGAGDAAAAPTTPAADAPADAPAAGAATPASPPAEAADATSRARTLFVEGMEAFQAGRYHDAIAAFRRARELVPSADLSFNVARAHEELGELEAAVENYRQYLRDRVDPPDRENVEEHIRALEERAEAARLAARQTPTTGTLRIDVDRPGATVRVDGRVLGTSPLALALSYSVGVHEIDVRLEGYVPFRARIRIAPGDSVVAVATLERATEYRSVRGHRRFTWVMAGLAGASLAASAAFGVMAAREQADGNRSTADRYALYSDLGTAGTAVFGLGTVVLYFAEGRSVRTERVP